MREETFGPVLPVAVSDALEQVVALANDCEFGLSGSVYLETDIRRGMGALERKAV